MKLFGDLGMLAKNIGKKSKISVSQDFISFRYLGNYSVNFVYLESHSYGTVFVPKTLKQALEEINTLFKTKHGLQNEIKR